jgi:hypothetical protein
MIAMSHKATDTSMSPVRQRFLDDVAACTAPLRRVMRRDGNDLLAPLLSFVSQHLHEHSPTRIQDRLVESALGLGAIGKIPATLVLPGFGTPSHVGNLQVFAHHHIRALQKLVGFVVQECLAFASHLGMCLAQCPKQAVPARGSFFRFAKTPLKLLQVRLCGPEMPGRFNMGFVTGVIQINAAQINAGVMKITPPSVICSS